MTDSLITYSQGERVDHEEFCEDYRESHVLRGFLMGWGEYSLTTCRKRLVDLRKLIQRRLAVALSYGRGNPLAFLRLDEPLDELRRITGIGRDLANDEELWEFLRLPMLGGAASTPTFASTGVAGLYALANGDSTNLTAAVITGVAAGTALNEGRVVSGPTTAPGANVMTVQVTDGSATIPIDCFTSTNTINLFQNTFRFNNQILQSTSYIAKLKMPTTAITSGGTLNTSLWGQNLT